MRSYFQYGNIIYYLDRNFTRKQQSVKWGYGFRFKSKLSFFLRLEILQLHFKQSNILNNLLIYIFKYLIIKTRRIRRVLWEVN